VLLLLLLCLLLLHLPIISSLVCGYSPFS
jgi:hypothetical protein